MLLEKETTIFQRDNKGQLLPQEIILETLSNKPTIEAIPLTKGELAKLLNNQEQNVEKDAELIAKYCINPKYTLEEAKLIRPKITTAIVIAIMALSMDTSQDELQKSMTDEILKKKIQNPNVN